MIKNILAARSATCKNGKARLVGGRNAYEGRVEICFNGEWGSVCGLQWYDSSVDLVCKQLGYKTPGNPETRTCVHTHYQWTVHKYSANYSKLCGCIDHNSMLMFKMCKWISNFLLHLNTWSIVVSQTTMDLVILLIPSSGSIAVVESPSFGQSTGIIFYDTGTCLGNVFFQLHC